MSGVRQVQRMEGFAGGVVGPLAISVWDGPSTVEHAQAAADLLVRLGETEKFVLVMAVVGATTPPPDSDVRSIVGRAMAQVAGKTRAVCQVVEGQGFRAAAIRGVLIGMGLVIRSKRPEKVCESVREGAVFLAQHSEGKLLAEDVVRAVAALRAG